MFPFLLSFTIAGTEIRVPSYGVFLAMAFSAAYFESLRRAFKQGDDPKHIENLFLLVVLSSIIGSRLFHVFFEEFSYYVRNPIKILAVWEGGYTLYGAMLAAIASLFVYCRTKKIDPLHFFDIAAPATALGIGIGRIGCFLAGCCWGKPSDLPWAVRFVHTETFSGLKGVAVHPTQLYESFGALLLAVYLFRVAARKTYEGQVLFHGLIGYALIRFLVELARGDEYRGYVLGGLLSYSQVVSLALLGAAILGVIIFGKKSLDTKKKKPALAKRRS